MYWHRVDTLDMPGIKADSELGYGIRDLRGVITDDGDNSFESKVRKSLTAYGLDVKEINKNHFAPGVPQGQIDALAFDAANDIVYVVEAKHHMVALGFTSVRNQLDEYTKKSETFRKTGFISKLTQKVELLDNNREMLKTIFPDVGSSTRFLPIFVSPDVTPAMFLREVPVLFVTLQHMKERADWMGQSQDPFFR